LDGIATEEVEVVIDFDDEEDEGLFSSTVIQCPNGLPVSSSRTADASSSTPTADNNPSRRTRHRFSKADARLVAFTARVAILSVSLGYESSFVSDIDNVFPFPLPPPPPPLVSIALVTGRVDPDVVTFSETLGDVDECIKGGGGTGKEFDRSSGGTDKALRSPDANERMAADALAGCCD
jgi:hypothetical protein